MLYLHGIAKGKSSLKPSMEDIYILVIVWCFFYVIHERIIARMYLMNIDVFDLSIINLHEKVEYY
jgi:hypothetical protein